MPGALTPKGQKQMRKNEMNKFRKVLEGNAVELNSSSGHRDAIAIEATADELDRLVGATEREIAVRNFEAKSAKRREIRAALLRIREGTYGLCVECDEQISQARLAAVPCASRCVRCQEAFDSDNKSMNCLAFPIAAELQLLKPTRRPERQPGLHKRLAARLLYCSRARLLRKSQPLEPRGYFGPSFQQTHRFHIYRDEFLSEFSK
jgi:DnaK suppressor protein